MNVYLEDLKLLRTLKVFFIGNSLLKTKIKFLKNSRKSIWIASIAEAKEQAGRCLECHIHPTFEGDICILCGGCVDVCPSYCLSMKTLDKVDGGEDLKVLADMEFGDQAVAQEDASVMLFDPLKCIRCGMCAQKCPTGACKMSVNEFEDCYSEVK